MSAIASGALSARQAPRIRRLDRPALERKASEAAESARTWLNAKLLQIHELPAWYDANDFIRSGYRPISESTRECLASLLYFHNESLNIYTHLIPAVATVSAVGYICHLFSTTYPQATFDDWLIFGFFIFTAVACMGLSAVYHTMTCHSEPLDHICLRADYSGIILLILGCFVSGIKMAFFCEPLPRYIYWTMILLLGCTSLFIMLSPFFSGPKWRGFRLGTFIGTALSGFVPIIHGLVVFGWDNMWQWSGMPYYFLEGGLFLTGAFFYATRFPESIAPGTFDLFGASHQIFHVLVVLATLAHSKGIFEAYDYNYHNRRCLA